MSVSLEPLQNQQVDYISLITQHGGEVYVVGGAVRNYLYNRFHGTKIPIKDYDFLVRLLDNENLAKILKNAGHVKEDVGEAFGIILFVPHGSETAIEFALPRTEESTGPGYRDFIVKADENLSLSEDFSRRDATVNAMALRVTRLDDLNKFTAGQNNSEILEEINLSEIIDPFYGINDIKNKIWKCVGDPSKRFVEDPNRIMRAFRQSAELNLMIESDTLTAISNDYHLMRSLIPKSYVRLFNELFRMIRVNNQKMLENLDKMNQFGILKFLGINKAKTNLNPDASFITKISVMMCLNELPENIKKWGHDRQITATNYFSPSDMNIMVSIQSFYGDVADIKNLYDMLKVAEKIHKLFSQQYLEIIKYIVEYLKEMNFINDEKQTELLEYLELSKEYPPTTDKLVVNGHMLMKKWNKKGTEIKETKELLLDLIFRNTLTNDLNCLENYLDMLYPRQV